ncbi:MAG: hypothetical protein U0269_31330 [Polyangiales bacterium]
MTYRADRSAIEHQLTALRQELATLATAVVDTIEFEAKRIALETEIAKVEGRIRDESPKIPLLARLKVIGPCDQQWTDMVGTDAVRRCVVCDQNVYNLEAMSVREIEDMILFTNGAPCTRLRRRRDGTIITRECVIAEGETRLRRKASASNVTVAVLTAMLAGTALYFWHSANQRRQYVIDTAVSGGGAMHDGRL